MNKTNKTPSTFESIAVNLETGELTYPKFEGFELDEAQVYRVARIHAQFCSIEMAIRHAVHGQIQAFLGARSLFGGAK
jgi:hypothetical protein